MTMSGWRNDGDNPTVRSIFSTPVLGRDANAALARVVRAGGDKAKPALDQMVAGNMRLVLSIARRYPDGNLNLHDRLQEGALGLMRAARKFDPDRGFSFATYASYWIRATIDRAIQENEHPVSVPHNVVAAIRRLRRVASMSDKALTDAEVDAVLQMGVRTSAALQVMSYVTVPMDAPAFPSLGGGDVLMSEVIADESVENPEAITLDRDVWVALRKCHNLNAREYKILSQYVSGDTYADIGLRHGLSRERVRQIIIKVVDLLREVLER